MEIAMEESTKNRLTVRFNEGDKQRYEAIQDAHGWTHGATMKALLDAFEAVGALSLTPGELAVIQKAEELGHDRTKIAKDCLLALSARFAKQRSSLEGKSLAELLNVESKTLAGLSEAKITQFLRLCRNHNAQAEPEDRIFINENVVYRVLGVNRGTLHKYFLANPELIEEINVGADRYNNPPKGGQDEFFEKLGRAVEIYAE